MRNMASDKHKAQSSKPPRKQHTVPNSYLVRFADSNSRVWVYDREKKELRKQPTEDTTIEPNFYTYRNKNGDKNYSIETDLFGKSIEPRASRIIDNLVKGNLPNFTDNRRDLCEFVTMQYLRSTAFRRDSNFAYSEMNKMMMRMSFLDEKRAKQTLDGYEKFTGSKLDTTPSEMVRYMREGNFDFEIPPEHHLQTMLSYFNEFYKIFFVMNWIFVRSKSNLTFITSDNPFSVMRFNSNPMQANHICNGELTIPISPSICLFMHDNGMATFWQDVDEKVVTNFNFRTIRFSDRYLISRKRKQLIKLIKDSKVDNLPRAPMIKLDTPY